MRFIRLLLSFLFCIASVFPSGAQELQVLSFQETPTDLRARTRERKDSNGDSCALICVEVALPEIHFDGRVVEQQSLGGEYLVYVTEGTKRLVIRHGSFLPLVYSFPEPVEGKHTYHLRLQLPSSQLTFVRLSTNVRNAILLLDGIEYSTESGSFDLNLPHGSYAYSLRTPAAGFESLAGTLTVPDTPFLEQNLVLPTTQKSVLQVRTEPDATISVDGVAVGNGTFKSTVSAGLHKVEVQLGEKEYHLEQTVDLSAGDQVVDMYLSSPLTIVYPPSAQFIIVPKEGALKPSSSTVKTGEPVMLLGDYEIVLKKKDYESSSALVTVLPAVSVPYFHFPRKSLRSKADNLFRGEGGEALDYKKAFKEYQKMAKKGDDLALFGLGNCYLNGLGVKEADEGQAKELFRQSMNLGNIDAAMALAGLTEGQEQFAAYSFAAEKGEMEAVQWMADWFFSKSRYDEALSLYQSLAEKDDAHSLCVLGDMYYEGVGVVKDEVKARDYYARVWASDQGTDETFRARERYIDLTWYAAGNKEKAMEEYAALGSHLSEQGLERLSYFFYKKGKNSDDAYEYYLKVKTLLQQIKSPELGWPDNYGKDMFDIGSFFYSRKQYSDALFFYLEAENAKSSIPEAALLHFRLAYIYNGHGAIDPVKSASEYEKASNLGDVEATFRLARDYEEGKGVPHNLSKAMTLYLKASRSNHAKANLHIGTIYSQHNEFGVDYEKAEKYWTLAAKAGNQQAMKNLIKLASFQKNSELKEYWENVLRQAQ